MLLLEDDLKMQFTGPAIFGGESMKENVPTKDAFFFSFLLPSSFFFIFFYPLPSSFFYFFGFSFRFLFFADFCARWCHACCVMCATKGCGVGTVVLRGVGNWNGRKPSHGAQGRCQQSTVWYAGYRCDTTVAWRKEQKKRQPWFRFFRQRWRLMPRLTIE